MLLSRMFKTLPSSLILLRRKQFQTLPFVNNCFYFSSNRRNNSFLEQSDAPSSTNTTTAPSHVSNVKESLQGDSPFEINSSRQMMIADVKISKSNGKSNNNFSKDNDFLPKSHDRSYNTKRTNLKQKSENNTENDKNQENSPSPYQKRSYSRDNHNPNNLPAQGLTPTQLQEILPQLNTVRNYYAILETFSPQNFVDLINDKSFTSNPANVLALNNLWTYGRKHRIFGTFCTPAFQEITELIADNIENLQVPENFSSFAFNLYKVNFKDVKPYQRIEQYVLANIEQFELKALSQIVFAFSGISRTQTVHDFSSFYSKLQVPLALRLREAVTNPNTDIKMLQKDYAQILGGFSKSQNLSREFMYVLEQFLMNHLTHFEPREKTVSLYTFANNDYFSKSLSEICVNDFLQSYESFNPQEISHLVVSLDKFDVIDEAILQIVREQFILKKNQMNLLDLADICSVLFKREAVDEELFQVIREIFRSLRSNAELGILCKLLTNASTLLNKELMPHRFFKTIITSLQIVSNKKELKGRLVDELREDALKIMHPQFKQLYLETLDNKHKLDYRQSRIKEDEDKKDSKDIKRKKHYAIEANQQKRYTMKGKQSENEGGESENRQEGQRRQPRSEHGKERDHGQEDRE